MKLLVLKLLSSVIILFFFLVIPLYYPFQMHNPFIVLAELLHTVILPETSIPVWLHAIKLDRIDTFLLVSFISRLPIIALFWPKFFNYLIPKTLKNFFLKKLEGIIIWAKCILTQLNLFTKKCLQKSNGKQNYKFNLWQFLASGMILFFVLMFNFFKKITIKIKNWFQKKNKKLQKIIIDLGYTGVVIGAIVPFVPGTREAGILSAIILGTNTAKILYNAIDVLRILVEVIVF